ncbi:MAG: hypothetical protein IKQ64_03055, partial [Bacteroidales bacterium]|nr:hypothetical protein [Bacteroidales bacterium]
MKRLFTTIAICMAAFMSMQAQELANFNFGGRGTPVVSPEIQGDSVTFRFRADYATVVKLSGSWMPNPYGGTVDMVRGANNVWS